MATRTTDKKISEMLKLSETILISIEDGKSLVEILSLCKKLSRLRNDLDALKWFSLELSGYDYTSLPQGVNSDEVYPIALSAGRGFQQINLVTKKNEPRFWGESIPHLEALIISHEVSLSSLVLPTNYTPAITKGSDHGLLAGSTYVQESYRDVLNAIRIQQGTLTTAITSKKSLLAKVRSNIYDYVLAINIQLKFEDITESIFQQTKVKVDKILQQTNPEVMKKFVAAYDRIKSNNSEEWSQAMSSCRNALKAFIDAVSPPSDEPYKTKDNRILEVTDIKVKNRLIAYIDEQTKGNKRKLLIARSADLEKRLHAIEDMLSQGTHDSVSKSDMSMCIIETYFFIASLLDLN